MSKPLTEEEIRIIRGALIKAQVQCMYPDDSDDPGDRIRNQSINHYETALALTDRLLKQLQ